MVVRRPVADSAAILAYIVLRIAQESDKATAKIRIRVGQYNIGLARFI